LTPTQIDGLLSLSVKSAASSARDDVSSYDNLCCSGEGEPALCIRVCRPVSVAVSVAVPPSVHL
jgi:hypothetical protein